MGLKIMQSSVSAAVISQGAADVMTSQVPVSRTNPEFRVKKSVEAATHVQDFTIILIFLCPHFLLILNIFCYLIASSLPKSWKLSNMEPRPKNADPQENLYEML